MASSDKKNQLGNGIIDLKRKWVDKHLKIWDYLIVFPCHRTSSFHWWEKEGLANNLFNTMNPELLSSPSMLCSWIEERILKFHHPVILHLLPQTWSVFWSNCPKWHWCLGIFHQPDRIPANNMLFTFGLLRGAGGYKDTSESLVVPTYDVRKEPHFSWERGTSPLKMQSGYFGKYKAP